MKKAASTIGHAAFLCKKVFFPTAPCGKLEESNGLEWKPVKRIFYNGTVYTGQFPLAEAFAVEGERFVFAGSSHDALALSGEGDELCDLGGRFVCAGFNDSHMHLLNYGRVLNSPRLDLHTGSLEEMLRCLREFPAAGEGWLVGRGWNQDYFTDVSRMPNRWDLDRVSTGRPVCAVRACGHALAVNSRGLEVLGITADTSQPEGGEIVLENGVPNGVFLDNAMDLVYRSIPAPGKEELKEMIRAACAALNAYGVTSVQSDDYCVFPNLPWQAVNEAYRELEAAGELTVRVYEQCNFADLKEFAGFVEAGNRTGMGSSRFRIGPLKMLGDGALGPRTAFLSRPYADDPTACGIPVFTQETFDEMLTYARAHGMQSAVHAIGDACLDRVLNALEKARQTCPGEDLRDGIVHCQITRPDQLERIAALGLHVYAQSIFLDYDTRIVRSRVGEELASTSYAWDTLRKRGVTVSNGTDCPVELPFALGGIQCAVTRTDLAGSGEPYLPEEAFTVQEALDSYTAAGAYASFEEGEKGKILPGMLADFVILEQNPFSVEPGVIGEIAVCAAYVGGEAVYSAERTG